LFYPLVKTRGYKMIDVSRAIFKHPLSILGVLKPLNSVGLKIVAFDFVITLKTKSENTSIILKPPISIGG
jgi:hypothetical protein